MLPLLRDGACIGLLTFSSHRVNAFSDKLVALAESFRDQALIAIQNTQLFNETQEALEQLTATAAILRVISESPSDVQPVFNAITETALNLFAVSGAALALREGDAFRVMSMTGLGQSIAGPFPDLTPLDIAANFPSRVILDRQMLLAHRHKLSLIDANGGAAPWPRDAACCWSMPAAP